MRLMFDEVRSNKIKSWLLVSFFIILISALGVAFGAYMGNIYFGVAIAMIIAIIYSMVGFFQGAT